MRHGSENACPHMASDINLVIACRECAHLDRDPIFNANRTATDKHLKENIMGARLIRACTAVGVAASCGTAYAHPGHGADALAGLLHPLLGLDHLLAMVAVGMWAASLGKRAAWRVPVCFTVVMVLAAAVGVAGMALPLVESGIAASILVTGLLIAFHVRLAPAAGAALVGLFALFHGHAHGAEMPALAAPWLYGAGFVITTGVLQGLGLLVGSALNRRQFRLSIAGALVAASGGWLLFLR